ncbi:hypothetical protein GCK72_004405 [Caenorhabditis remanei]|uniref:Uncharacterized protein n=1 Tax=Caenorhabditis remanei TaxID=31234 RepID=A0A6A5HBC2_CAERE|nr:hypothetical protein GCK72_004405 [Caenorhabditis remanei]KAF1764457.1 hypothetical protein GCK72_004405 [Caenorhabditis remanei]
MVISYHKGWIVLEGNAPNKTFSEFYTTDVSEMPKVSSLWDYPFLFIGMLLITHYYAFSVVSMTGLIMERCCATYWINDYETKRRPRISISIFLFLEIFTIFVVYRGINLLFNVYYWIVFGILVLTFNFLLFGYIWYWNIRVHKILDTIQVIPAEYTLQARFQAKENARSLNHCCTREHGCIPPTLDGKGPAAKGLAFAPYGVTPVGTLAPTAIPLLAAPSPAPPNPGAPNPPAPPYKAAAEVRAPRPPGIPPIIPAPP